MNKVFVIVFALLALPAVAMSQTPDERIQAALLTAQAHGIPVSLLEEKIAEGRAKGVSMERIAAAVERRAAGLARAQEALAGNGAEQVTETELSIGEHALGMGVSEAVLAKLAETAHGERRGAAIAALTELVAQGVAPEAALERVTEALSKGQDALANLPAQAAEARARQGQPEVTGRPAAIMGTATSGPKTTLPASSRGPAAGTPRRGR
jgi:hypothetical protein